MQRAAIYVRASQDREGRQTSVTDQERVARALAERRGLTVVGLYADNDRGASTRSRKRRPEFERLTADAARGAFEVIVAYSSSRLTRRPREFELLIELAEKHGTRIITDRSGDPDFTTAQGRAVARTLAAWDAAQAEQIGENIDSSIAGRLAAGKDLGGPRPFGWEVDRQHHRAAEADAIRLGVRMILDGHSIRGVAKAWDAMGVTPPRSKYPFWRSQTVRHILLNPRNAGRLVVKGVDYGSPFTPIIDPEDAERVRVILTDPARAPKRGPEPMSWTGLQLLKCGACGHSIHATISKGAPALKCDAASRVPGRHPVALAGIVEAQLALTALLEVWDRLTDGDPDFGSNPDVAAAQMRVAELSRRLAQTEADYDADLIDGTRYATKRAKILPELEAARSALDTLLAASETASAVEVAKAALTQLDQSGWEANLNTALPAWREWWYSQPVTGRRRLARALWRDVRLMPVDDWPGRLEFDGVRQTVDGYDWHILRPDWKER